MCLGVRPEWPRFRATRDRVPPPLDSRRLRQENYNGKSIGRGQLRGDTGPQLIDYNSVLAYVSRPAIHNIEWLGSVANSGGQSGVTALAIKV